MSSPSMRWGMCAKSKMGTTYRIPRGGGSSGFNLSNGGFAKQSQLEALLSSETSCTARSSPLAKLVQLHSEISANAGNFSDCWQAESAPYQHSATQRRAPSSH